MKHEHNMKSEKKKASVRYFDRKQKGAQEQKQEQEKKQDRKSNKCFHFEKVVSTCSFSPKLEWNKLRVISNYIRCEKELVQPEAFTLV